MPKFIIGIKEIHEASIPIEANTIEEALNKAEEEYHDGMTEYDSNYSYTLDRDEWSIFQEKDKKTGYYIKS